MKSYRLRKVIAMHLFKSSVTKQEHLLQLKKLRRFGNVMQMVLVPLILIGSIYMAPVLGGMKLLKFLLAVGIPALLLQLTASLIIRRLSKEGAHSSDPPT